MSHFGLHPRLAHMILKAQRLNASYEASLLAVVITEKDIFRNAKSRVDLRERIEILHEVTQNREPSQYSIDLRQYRMLLTQAKRIEQKQKKELNSQILGLLLAFAYPDRIAALRHTNQGTYLLSNGKGAMLHSDDPLFNASFLVVSDLNAKATNATIYKAIELSRIVIQTHLTEQIKVYDAVTWSEEFQRVEVRQITRLGAITLKEKQIKTTQSDEVLEVLLDEFEDLGLEVLAWSREVKALKDRVNFFRVQSEKNNIGLPDFSSEYLLKHMDEWLAPYLTGITTLKACQNLNLHTILRGLLSYEQSQELDILAPEKLTVPSGSKITIDYSNPTQPILAVRLQEMFGCSETPKVMRGSVKLMLHLLSPAKRPIQITQDLESF